MRSIDGVVARPGEAMARHVALRIGGPADWFVVVHRREALAPALAELKALGHRVTPLGAGTRLRFWDGQVGGAWLRLGVDFQRVRIEGDEVVAGAAVPLCELARLAAEAGLTGLEGLAGLPGTLGASLLADDGPGEGWHSLVRSAERVLRGALCDSDLAAARRAGALVCGARIALSPGSPEQIAARMDAGRRANWSGAHSPWWSHPAGGSVRAELARVAMKGVRLRGVVVPGVAPELLVNLGRGTATDVELLQKSASERVLKLRGVKLVSAGPWAGERGSAS